MKKLLFASLLGAVLFAQTPPAAAPAAETREPGLYAKFETSLGTIVTKLYEKETPITVQNFVALAQGTKAWADPKSRSMVKKPMYDGITFHRVIPNFMIQTGDPTATGAHNCGFTIRDEFLPGLRFDRPGRLAMANIGQPNTGACQFFITEQQTPSLNDKHTIFGQVVSGQDIVNKIARVKRNADDKPLTPVVLKTVTIERVGPEPQQKKK